MMKCDYSLTLIITDRLLEYAVSIDIPQSLGWLRKYACAEYPQSNDIVTQDIQ